MNDIVNRLRTNRDCLAPCLMDEAADTIERLTAERDEARRMYCEEVEHHHETVWNDGERDFKPLPALDVAISKGWDCYPEATP
jgi:predicted glycosyltransferase